MCTWNCNLLCHVYLYFVVCASSVAKLIAPLGTNKDILIDLRLDYLSNNGPPSAAQVQASKNGFNITKHIHRYRYICDRPISVNNIRKPIYLSSLNNVKVFRYAGGTFLLLMLLSYALCISWWNLETTGLFTSLSLCSYGLVVSVVF